MPLTAQTDDEVVDVDSDNDVDSALVDSIIDSDTVKCLPWPENVQTKVGLLLQSDMFQTSQVGMMIWDLTADSCIYKQNERQLMRPASCMKLVTAITAIDELGGGYQFKTRLKYTGRIKDKVLDGDLYCIGGMDPRFNADDMTAFAASLSEMGIDTIRGNIYADKSMKDSNLFGEGWCWDDDNYTLSPLLISREDSFVSRFIDKLHDDSIFYAGPSDLVKQCPSESYLITTRAHSIDQILMKMMKESNNLYAESMYYQIAASTGNHPASAKSARAVERRLVNKVGLDASKYKFADGSGLSLYNYVTAEMLVRLLRYAVQNDNIYMHLLPSLPIAGVDGTLRKRMKGSLTCGNVHAKTGTLTGCISLSGYCTASNGHRLCFSIINNGIMHDNNARNFQNKVCMAMCQP